MAVDLLVEVVVNSGAASQTRLERTRYFPDIALPAEFKHSLFFLHLVVAIASALRILLGKGILGVGYLCVLNGLDGTNLAEVA